MNSVLQFFGLLALTSSPAAAQAPEAPICTDRPSKANGVCTVPPRRVQIEANGPAWSLTKSDGVRTELTSLASTFVKVGLSARSDLQIGITPYARLKVEQGDLSDSISGFGDMVARYKHRLTSEDAKVQLGVIPFIKIPTAKDGLGNGKVEGGLAVPVSFSIGGPVTMTLGPEADLLGDSDGSGRHVAIVNLVNLSAPVAERVTVSGELWTNLNFDPADTVWQASADASIAYAITNDVQLDAGANFGLTRDTPDIELYGGVSVRF